MFTFLRRLWRKHFFVFDEAEYSVPDLAMRDYERVDDVLSSLPSVGFGFHPFRLNVDFLPECIDEPQIRAALERAGFHVTLVHLKRADRE